MSQVSVRACSDVLWHVYGACPLRVRAALSVFVWEIAKDILVERMREALLALFYPNGSKQVCL